MKFVNSRKNKELVKYIIIFSDHLVEGGENAESILEKISFCHEELEFWLKRKNPNRYQESLRSLLQWLFDKAESDF